MASQVALLRGINVGSGRKFPMARQRALMAELGFEDVTVHLQSGNIVFADPGAPPERTARRLEDAFAADLGFSVPVMVRTRDELAAIVDANPYPAAVAEPKTLHVVFLSEVPTDTSALDALDTTAYAPDEFRLVGRELYLHLPGGLGRSKLAAKLTNPRLGVTATARNWNTVTKLLALADNLTSARRGGSAPAVPLPQPHHDQVEPRPVQRTRLAPHALRVHPQDAVQVDPGVAPGPVPRPGADRHPLAVVVMPLARQLYGQQRAAALPRDDQHAAGPCRGRRSPRTEPTSRRSRPGSGSPSGSGAYSVRTRPTWCGSASTVAVGPVLPGSASSSSVPLNGLITPHTLARPRWPGGVAVPVRAQREGTSMCLMSSTRWRTSSSAAKPPSSSRPCAPRRPRPSPTSSPCS